MNPFEEKINKDYLLNLKTGRKATEDTEGYLLNIFTKGIERRDEFINECNGDPNRFEKPIKKTKIINFATFNMAKTNKSKTVTVTVTVVVSVKDLFGCLLQLKKYLNIHFFLNHPASAIQMEQCIKVISQLFSITLPRISPPSHQVYTQ